MLVRFYIILTLGYYLMPNPVYTYMYGQVEDLDESNKMVKISGKVDK